MSTAVELPRWDMTVVFPDLHSPEFENAFNSIIQEIGDLGTFFDDHGIQETKEVAFDESIAQLFNDVTSQLSELAERLGTLQVYISSFVATDSRNELAQARMSQLQQHLVRLSQVHTRYTAWIGSLDMEALIETSATARELEFFLRREKFDAQHLMPSGEEDLAAELNVTGGSAWAKLHSNMTSQLTVPFEIDGESRALPMSLIRNMASDENRETRRRAYEAELLAWKGVEVPLAAALNSIKGQSNTVEGRRGWESPLDLALFLNSIDRPTLDAMMDAAHASFPEFRRYFRLKAQALGLPILAWYDLSAPVGKSSQTWDFDDARIFLLDQFGSYSDRLRNFAARAFEERWIDAEPRPGKRDGAFCTSLRRDESRILSNFQADYNGMSTLAHELGHAYHNFNLAHRPVFQRASPMTLAETASIFCETIVREAALERVGEGDQIAILEASLESSAQVVVDITSRFLFEQGVLDRRRERELSPDELSNLMLRTQAETYGDALDSSLLHPYMWAVKGHYYSVGRPYYNFPYMFGLLFGLGLYAHYRRDPDAFRAGYDGLLSSTGLADVATLAARFDVDVRDSYFWNGSLGIISADIDRFETLIGAQ